MISYISVLDGGFLKFFQDLFRSRNQWVVERLGYQDFSLEAFAVVLSAMCDLYCALPYEFPYSHCRFGGWILHIFSLRDIAC